MALNLTISKKAELQKLQKEVKERWTYVRITSILMLSESFSIVQISSALGIDDNSVYRYQKAYIDLPVSDFLSRDYPGYFGKSKKLLLIHK